MFKNFLIIAVRNFWRNKIFSFINVIGLSIGISAALVIYLIVHYDFTFDKFEKDNDRIYRVVTDMKFAGSPILITGVPSPLPDAVSKEISGMELTTGFQQFSGEPTVKIEKNNADKPVVYKKQQDIIFADANYFKLLQYQWLAGSPKNSLNEPFKVVLTEQRAKIYFPDKNVSDIIGKRIIYDDSIITTVSGVVKNLNANTDFIFKEFISISTIPATNLKNNYGWENWQGINSSSQLFLKLTPGVTVAKTEAQLKILLKKYDKNLDADSKNTRVLHLQALGDIHFNYGNFGNHSAHKPTLYGLLAVAAFLLLLGCINFINLTTALASQRAKEIGIRKTMGSSAKQLMLQFLSETFLITIIATLISLLIAPLLIKVFADFIPSDLHFDILHQPHLILFLITLVIAVSFLSGFYPALVLSQYNPALVLKNQFYAGKNGTRKAMLRKGLTVSQFFIAQVFIMATLVTVKQINFMINKDMGFKKDAIISFEVPFNFDNFSKPDTKRFVLLNQLKSIAGIDMVSMGSSAPASAGWSTGTMTYKDGKKEIETNVEQKNGDTNYIKLFHLKLLAGRNIEQGDTTKNYLINETYMHILGFQKPQDAINKQINSRAIVGVMADFNEQSLHSPIKPLAFSGSIQYGYNFHIALKPQDADGVLWKSTIAEIEKLYRQNYPVEDFNYQFFDESIAKFYKSEQDISRLLKWATGLAVLISCLGLLGLVIYTTNTRTKEIGVRKVLGASVSDIVSILSKDFVVLVLIAFVIAIPVSWWAMYTWLQNFAFKTTISWWIFLASGLLMTIMALVTISIQTIRAANVNPVKSLRSE